MRRIGRIRTIKLNRHSDYKSFYFLPQTILPDEIQCLRGMYRIKGGCNELKRVGDSQAHPFGTVIDS